MVCWTQQGPARRTLAIALSLTTADSSHCCRVPAHADGHILSHWGIVAANSPLNVPNAAVGLLFYVLSLLVAPLGIPRTLFLAASLVSLAFSLFLAYVLRFVLHDLCLVCVSSYALNAVIFVGAARAVMSAARAPTKRDDRKSA
jgi:hypothetical protein